MPVILTPRVGTARKSGLAIQLPKPSWLSHRTLTDFPGIALFGLTPFFWWGVFLASFGAFRCLHEQVFPSLDPVISFLARKTGHFLKMLAFRHRLPDNCTAVHMNKSSVLLSSVTVLVQPVSRIWRQEFVYSTETLSRRTMSAARTGLLTTQNPAGQPQPSPEPQLVETLRNQIRKLETAERVKDAKVISTGCSGLDQLLMERGLVTGTITEWLAPAFGCGAELLSLLAAREACADGGALVIIDPEHRFYPPAAAAWGIHLENVIVLRGPLGRDTSHVGTPLQSRGLDETRLSPRSKNGSLLWAIDQSLRCPAVAAVWGRLGHVSERWLRRFQLSAELSGAMGLFVRPASVKGQPGWSEVQWQVMEKNGVPPSLSNSLSNSDSRISASKSQPPGSVYPMPAPMRQAYERFHQEKQMSPLAFDRLVSLRLLRVRSGHANTQNHITLQIDFTTGKVQTVTRTHEPSKKHTEQRTTQKHSVHLAAQLAHPKTGGRRQRA